MADQYKSREQQAPQARPAAQAPPRSQPAQQPVPRAPQQPMAASRVERAPAQPQAPPVNLTISPAALPDNSPALGIDWRPVDLDSNRSYGCTVSAAAGEPITLTIHQPPYQRTLRGAGAVTLTAIPAAPANTPGELTARNDATGATAVFRWVWVSRSGAVAAPPASKAAAAAPPSKAMPATVAAHATAKQTAAGAPAGASATAFFGQHAVGRRIAFILDMSGSMRGPRWETLKEEFARSIRMLPPDVECFVVTFCSGCYEPREQRDWGPATPERIDLLLSWIGAQRPWGGTAPGSAFRRVFTLSAPPDTIYFLTDGALEFFGPAECAEVRGANRTVINTIALDEAGSAEALQQMAAESGGSFAHVNCPNS